MTKLMAVEVAPHQNIFIAKKDQGLVSPRTILGLTIGILNPDRMTIKEQWERWYKHSMCHDLYKLRELYVLDHRVIYLLHAICMYCKP